jgi:ABC-type multidrug transport system ATPase subunit
LDLDKGQVDFQHVKFSYDRKKQVINDLSFHVAPGQTVALIGETGGGKSTILKLLFRFYDVAGGGILIDGQDVRDVTLESLRENIGVVPQDPQLFNDTILANIRYARLDATDEEVIEACKAAAVHEKILTLANGYASRVGEHGIALSGGELQRIAIARAILKNPKIILLDEATSSVDSETEAKIQDALRRVCQNRTTFVAAHRLSTIIDADLILVIKDGAILEQGTPSDLLASKGKYYSLWSKEMGIFDAIKKQVDDLTEDRADSSESLAKGKRPASVARSNGVYGSYGKKAFRPDAPEFVPNYQRASLASNSVSEEAKPESPAPRQVLDNLEGNSVEKKPRSRKRKPKPDAGSVNSISLLDGSSEVLETPAVNSDSRSKTDQALIPKRPRYNRRHQVRSEPAGQGVTESQADVSSDRDGMPIGSIEGKPMARSARRVTAPSDPPSGPSTNTSKRRTRSRGLPNWKKNRNSSGTSSIAETRSSSGNVDWASDAPTLSMPPAAPFTSPAAGVTPSTGLAGSVSRAGVRFAPGF